MVYDLHVTTSWVKCPLWVNQRGQLSLPSLGVVKWVVIRVITWITEVETINGRPGLRMAVRRRPKSMGAGLAYGLLAICWLCLWRIASLQLQLPLVALY